MAIEFAFPWFPDTPLSCCTSLQQSDLHNHVLACDTCSFFASICMVWLLFCYCLFLLLFLFLFLHLVYFWFRGFFLILFVFRWFDFVDLILWFDFFVVVNYVLYLVSIHLLHPVCACWVACLLVRYFTTHSSLCKIGFVVRKFRVSSLSCFVFARWCTGSLARWV